MRKVFTGILISVGVATLVGIIYLNYLFSKIKFTNTFSPEDVGVQNTQNSKIYGVTSEIDKRKISNSQQLMVAVFGVDKRIGYEIPRSDTIMIVALDQKNKTIKIVSVMRDILVEIPNYGKEKLNSAYALGGPKLAITVLNKILGLSITKYVSIDFKTFEKIVDSIGGVDVEIKDYEVEQFNISTRELNRVNGGVPAETIQEPGVYRLNGRQALAYARIRYAGNGDFERTSRQRYLLSKIFEKVKTLPIDKKMYLIEIIFENIETNIRPSELLSLALINITNYKLETFRIPVSGFFEETTEFIERENTNLWVLKIDIEKNKQELVKFLKTR
ncbi:LCP family protein [Fervidobacterium nodosum]|uniref:Cell envelope-related transcriptional attenuator n=1 Tax=Fervidobacterium nodosum (strain ATCC 35602 / DSM 5306 / Rt17-B1) TaxID=381764 RepID=A7HMC2_FERNB|nr:LCP family protein [Fervidobacterium nodosum]ABS61055.1 cell envelope-related transcriptional attenuator [Fervidobacterium nodosum Rt17-B1]